MGKRFKPKEANKEYEQLQGYAAARTKEIAPMLAPYVQATDRYGRLLCRLCLLIGEEPPGSIQDTVVRDLMADVFDFLYESRVFILRGQTLVAYPLARRAYESLSLLSWCVLDGEAAEKWAKGKRYSNSDVRKALGAHQMGEPEKELQEVYSFFSGLTHPNREMIAFRGLGEGNQFVFGSIERPNLVVLADYCRKHLELWFWFCPVVGYFYRELLLKRDKSFFDVHDEARKFAQEVNTWLVAQFNRLLEESKNEKDVVKPRFAG